MHIILRTIGLAQVLICLNAYSQTPVTFEKLQGTWDMKFNLHGQIQKQSVPDGALEQAVLNGVTTFVETLTNAMKIQITFKTNEAFIISTQYDQEKPEVKKGTYSINKKGQLRFSSDQNFNTSSDIWVLIGKNLYPVNEDGTINKGVFLARIN